MTVIAWGTVLIFCSRRLAVTTVGISRERRSMFSRPSSGDAGADAGIEAAGRVGADEVAGLEAFWAFAHIGVTATMSRTGHRRAPPLGRACCRERIF